MDYRSNLKSHENSKDIPDLNYRRVWDIGMWLRGDILQLITSVKSSSWAT